MGKIGKNIIITAVDDKSNEPHALEVIDGDRWIKGVLWHPEATFLNEMSTVNDEKNDIILKSFIDKCKKWLN